MKIYSVILLISIIISSAVANDYKSQVANIEVSKSNGKSLSIQNLSVENVEFYILGKEFILKPITGLSYLCIDYETIVLEFKNINHDFFEIPCQSNILINKTYSEKKGF